MATIEKGDESEVFTVETRVVFAAAGKPFEHEYTSITPASEVLADAMHAFEISTDGTTRYYLLHGGVEVAADQMIGALVDEHAGGRGRRQLVLKLRTETVSG
ncbi:MAG: hypothetical protein JWR34_737 [Mycobacterium sp.]|nr:hypothetical protein [Mycobacterium sp.]